MNDSGNFDQDASGDSMRQGEPQAESFAPAPPFTDADVEAGHGDAIMCYALNYAFFPYALRALIARDNPYTLYHAKQAFLLWAAFFAVLGLGLVLLPVVGLGLLVWLAGFPPLGVLNFLGLLQALNDEAKLIPFLDRYPHEWIRLNVKGR